MAEQTDSGLSISISSADGQALFCGRGDRISACKEEGMYCLCMEFYGYTRDWDLTEKSQSFCKGNDTFEQVLRKVLSEYQEKDIRDEATGGAKIPGMLLQYEETEEMMSQEMTGWRVRTGRQLSFGEQVMLGHIENVVTAVYIHTE
ncbi:MAG: hypothetical protein HDR28_11735 [Lachnospiraceae bacterium]|nr:hypothetical protein [Lachnospiraceae bacterium]